MHNMSDADLDLQRMSSAIIWVPGTDRPSSGALIYQKFLIEQGNLGKGGLCKILSDVNLLIVIYFFFWWTFRAGPPNDFCQVGMNGNTFSIKAPKECPKKFAASFKGEFLTREHVLRIFFLFLDDFGVPL